MAWYDDDPVATPAGLNPHLMLVRQLEGSGDTATSPKGARGRYQIMPDTARRYGFDPSRLGDEAYSARVASAILDDNAKRAGGRLDDTLVLYNASPRAYQRWVASGRNPAALPAETQKYLARAEKLNGAPLAPPAWAAKDPVVEPAPQWAAKDPVVTPGADDTGILGQIERKGGSLVGGLLAGGSKLVHGLSGLADAFTEAQEGMAGATGQMAGPGGEPMAVPPQLRPGLTTAAQAHPDVVARATAPVVSGLAAADQAVAPANRSGLESFLHGAGEMAPALGAGIADPLLMAGAFAGQGYGEAHDEAVAAGAGEDVAREAGVANAGVQGGLGLIPVGEVAAGVTQGIEAAAPRVAARLAANAGGDAALGAAMQTGSNVVAQQTYDPNREWYEQVPESAAMMAGGGLIAHGVFGAGHLAGRGLDALRPRLRPDDVAPGTPPPPEAMPEANAIRAYQGLPPLEAENTHVPLDAEAEAERARLAEQAKAAQLGEGQPVLVRTSGGMAKGEVVGVDPAEGPAPASVRVRTGAGVHAVPLSATEPLPQAYEAARELHGAPLEQMPQAGADVSEWRAAAPAGASLFRTIRNLGGIRTRDAEGAPNDAAEVLQDVRHPGLVNNKTGFDPDTMRELLQERGWFGDFDQSQVAQGAELGAARRGDTTDELFELMRREASGEKVFHPADTTPAVLARRADLDGQMQAAGVGAGDSHAVATAKLAAWRGEQVRSMSGEMAALRARAEALGLEVRPDATRDEVLVDVLEREAIRAEAPAYVPDGTEADHYQNALGQELTPEQRYEFAVLTPDEHEWLSHPDRGPRGREGEARGPEDHGEPPGPAGEDEGQARTAGEGAGLSRADQGGDREEDGLATTTGATFAPHPSYGTVDHWNEFVRKYTNIGTPERYRQLYGVKPPRGARTDEQLPTSERQDIGGETVDQTLIPGAERSARQAAQARAGALKPRVAQREAGGLFATPESESHELFPTTTRPEAKPEDLFAPPREPEPEAPREIAATPEAREARARAETGEGYGARNKVFTREMADAARARIRDKLRNQLNAGLDPELMLDGLTLAGYHIEAGARKFGDFTRAMLEDLGERATPFLRMWYNAVRDYPGFDHAHEMTPHGLVTDDEATRIASDVLRSRPDLEQDRPGGEALDAHGPQPLPAGPGEAQRGPGGPGAGDAAAGGRAPGGDGLPDRGPAPLGESGPAGLQPGAPGDAGRAAGRLEPGGGHAPGDEGVQPDRTPAESLDRASAEAAHLEPISQQAHKDAESVDAPPVSHELEAALPTLFPEQRADVAFAEQRFEAHDTDPAKAQPGVLFTNGTGTGKTFTGGGIAKRFYDRGKKNILVLAPTQGILSHWSEALEKLGVPFRVLEDTSRAGSGPVGTTYAALTANRTLADRNWDLVISDEAHTLSSAEDGSETGALKAFRAITNHPDRLYHRAELEHRAEVDAVEKLRPPQGVTSGPLFDRWREGRQTLDDKLRARVEELRTEPRAKAAFLSATPFAYDKSVEWAHGYLFDFGPEPRSTGYNTGSARDQFFMRHFGYRMRYNKLTKPEAAVESEVMEREFHEWLRRNKVLSGRALTVDKDYDRKFVLVDGGVGRQIDEAMAFLRSAEDGRFRNLAQAVEQRFDYLSRARLLEAIKAKAAAPIIRQHLALGRKVVVFHNYNDGGGFSPFEYDPAMEVHGSRPGEIKALHEAFVAANPYVTEIDAAMRGLAAPLVQLGKAFPTALVYNGRVPKGQRERAKAAFNTDGGPHNLIIVQSDAGQAGISLHDVTGRHQRVTMNLGLPGRPVAAIQQEGRTYRIGQASDAIFRYLNTGTNWERRAFATKIAERAGTAENLALGAQARTLREAFVNAFLESAAYPPMKGEGQGGKAADRALAKAVTEFQRAKSLYFAQAKKGRGRAAAREGLDYFATPEPLGLKMAEWADIRAGDKVLEPSAGHGAIARFFPETADRTLIEPSEELASRAALTAPGARVLSHRFEDLHAVNKYDAVVMNPPFGHGGATAIDHLAKAAGHLKEGGRIVALIPEGPAADARFEKFYESDAAKGLYKIADIRLPASTFERAGTSVRTHVVVLERHAKPEDAAKLQETQRDYSDAETTQALFDRIEHASLPERARPPQAEQAAPAAAPKSMGGFETAQTLHGKTGEPLFVATARERVAPEDYQAVLAIAKKHGGWYSSFRGSGAVPGFQFRSEAERQKFLDEADVSGPKFQRTAADYDRLLEAQRGLEGLRAAVRTPRGRVYEGASHSAAEQQAPDREGLTYGFTDERGRFIPRTEAERRYGVLTMEDVGSARFQRAFDAHDAAQRPDIFAGVEPMVTRPAKGPFAEPAADPRRAHFDQNHADLARLASGVGDKAQRTAEAERLASEMGVFMDWDGHAAAQARLRKGEPPTAAQMLVAAREYARDFAEVGAHSRYDPEAYHDLVRRWYEAQGGERPQFQRGPVFYSAVERVVSLSPMKAAPADQWKATLANAPGVKREELEWTGVNDWLDLFRGEKVPKEKLEAFLRDNGVKVEEKVLGDEPKGFDPSDYHVASLIAREFGRLEDRRRSDLEDQAERAGLEGDEADEWVQEQIDGEWGEIHDEAEQAVQSEWRGEQEAKGSQYDEWTLPGGKNYRELLLTLPAEANPPATHWDTPGVMAHVRFDERTDPEGRKVLFLEELQSDWHQKGRDQGYAQGASAEEVAAARAHLAEVNSRYTTASEELRHVLAEVMTHFNAPLTAAEHLEALPRGDGPENFRQLQRMDLGKRQGLPQDLQARIDAALDAFQRVDLQQREAMQRVAGADRPGIPDAPFKTSWPALVMKRMIRWAVDHGFERVAWTTGEQQGERYDLTKHVGRLTLHDNSSGGIGHAEIEGPFKGGDLIVHDPNGNQVTRTTIRGWAQKPGETEEQAARRELEAVIGPQLAERLLAQSPRAARSAGLGVRERHLEGLDVKIGDEGMRAFYDRNLVNITNDLIKKYGGKVEKVDLVPSGWRGGIDRLQRLTAAQERYPDLAEMDAAQLAALLNRGGGDIEKINAAHLMLDRLHHPEEWEPLRQHGFEIPPKLREVASGGFPLFKREMGELGPYQRMAARNGEPGPRVAPYVRLTEAKTPDARAQALIGAVDAEIERIAPFAEVRAAERAHEYTTGENRALGGLAYRDGLRHVVIWALDSADPLGAGRHEALHTLRDAGLFHPDEWEALSRAAVSEGWLERYKIDRLYAEYAPEDQVEEAIAERFREWRRAGEPTSIGGMIHAAFARLAKFLDRVRDLARRAVGKGPDARDVLSRIEAGEVGSRLGLKAQGDLEARFARGPDDYRQMLEDQRAVEGLRAAMRDPVTGRVFTGRSHQDAIERAGEASLKAPEDDPIQGVYSRLSDAWDRATPDSGFVDRTGNFISRDEAERRWNILTMEDARDFIRNRPKFARRPDIEERRPQGFINRALGHGVDSVGRRLKATAERWTPDPVADALDSLKLGVTPMGIGSERAQAEAKDFANALRANTFAHGRIDDWLAKSFTPEQRQRMWAAADEHGVILRRGAEPGPGEGMNRLTAAERQVVEHLQKAADDTFERAKEMDMVTGEGLESYVPRMVATMTAAGVRPVARASPRQARKGGNLSVTTGQLRQRKYETVEETEAAAKASFGQGALVIRDIRTLNLATQRLEAAIAGRALVDKIKGLSQQVAADLPVVEGGGNPDPGRYFTLDHPAMTKWAPRFIRDADTGKFRPLLDEKGDLVFEASPIWIPREFEGPLKAVLSEPSNGLIKALVALKAKMIGVVMYNPLIHNAVIWGKAIPADPRGVLTFEVYRRGNAAKLDPKTMNEAISAGLDPIGHRYFNQDLASIADDPAIVPGRSWTSQVLAFVPGLFSREAGEAVKRQVDAMGDVWHNTFLWDRVADLQMGIYTHVRDGLLRRSNELGLDARSAQRIAAHFANRYAGALPMEGMSKLARTTANLVLFSRSFTLGNLAAYKDIVAGLPSDVRAQIQRDGGLDQLERVQGAARQKATAMLILDIGLSIAGLTLAAAATAWLTGQKFQAPWENEEDRQNRFLIGYQKDGTAIYGRLPTGKVGEELYDWSREPREILLRKLSPFGRLAYLLASNDKGFGRPLNDPEEKTPVISPVKHLARAMWQALGPPALLPEGQLSGMVDLAQGSNDPSAAALRAFLPFSGVTVSKGAPGGPAQGDLYRAKAEHDFQVQQALPGIRDQLRRGDVAGARAKMRELGIPAGLQNFYVRTAANPAARFSRRTLRDFMLYASPEEKARFEADRQAQAGRAGP